MSNFPWMFILVLMLIGLGTATLVFITVKYYWGERGNSAAYRREATTATGRGTNARCKADRTRETESDL